MKRLWAMVFSLALILAQAPLFAHTTIPASQKNCCDCGGKCCASKDDSSAKDIPAVPAPNSTSQKNLQAATFLLLGIFVNSTTPVHAGVAPAVLVSAQSVPLFVQNCSYLL